MNRHNARITSRIPPNMGLNSANVEQMMLNAMMTKPANFTRRFMNDTAGNFAMLGAIGTMAMVLGVGLAVDTALLRKTKLDMQNMADVISLAIAKEELSDKADMRALGDAMLLSQFGDTSVKISDMSKVDDDYKVSLNTNAKTIFMQIIKRDQVSISVNSQTTYERLNLDLALVLDNTGSMKGTKLTALKAASNDLVDTLMDGRPAAAGTQIGLVPFAQWVNVGDQYARETWLDQRGASAQNETYFDRPVSRFDLYDTLGVRWNGCVENRLPPYDVDDTPADPANPATLFQPAFHPDMSDNVRRGYTYLADNTGGNSIARLKSTAKYSGALSGRTAGPAYAVDTSCSDDRRKLTPLTGNKGVIKRAISDMYAQGYTNIANGASWGFRAISPHAPFTQGRPYSDKKTQKAMVILTDGEQTIGGPSGDFRSGYTPFGFLGEPAVGGKNRLTGASPKAALDSKLLQVCKAAKAKGILVYTITFELNDTATKQTMEDCATSPGMYFDAKNAAQLSPAFREIAASLGALRISG